jgi:hypothetical protein
VEFTSIPATYTHLQISVFANNNSWSTPKCNLIIAILATNYDSRTIYVMAQAHSKLAQCFNTHFYALMGFCK